MMVVANFHLEGGWVGQWQKKGMFINFLLMPDWRLASWIRIHHYECQLYTTQPTQQRERELSNIFTKINAIVSLGRAWADITCFLGHTQQKERDCET